MGYMKKALTDLKQDAYEECQDKEKPGVGNSLSYFGRCVLYSSKLIFTEKEIITFAILQLVCIGLGYLLWVQILDWIPEEVWASERKSNGGHLLDLVFLLWSFLCVGITTYPIGILTACMGAAHFLHEKGEESTIAKCLRIVMPRAFPIWIFSWIDGWWTINRIIERLPKKRDRVPLAQKLINEAIYQAWKVASLGFLPALIIGRSVKDGCKDSLGLLKTHFKTICQLRVAYSAICWIFGIGCYVVLIYMARQISLHMRSENDMYTVYMMVLLPLILTLFFIQVFFRPIYILSACRIYSNYIRENDIKVELPTVSKFYSSVVLFLVLCLIVGTVFIYRDELGITEFLSTPH